MYYISICFRSFGREANAVFLTEATSAVFLTSEAFLRAAKKLRLARKRLQVQGRVRNRQSTHIRITKLVEAETNLVTALHAHLNQRGGVWVEEGGLWRSANSIVYSDLRDVLKSVVAISDVRVGSRSQFTFEKFQEEKAA